MSSASIRRRRPPRLSAVVQNDEMGWLAGGPAKMAATNKCLAQNNKPRHRANATKKRKGTCGCLSRCTSER